MSIQDPVNERDIHKRNIHDLQSQLHEAYKRITDLNKEVTELKQRIKDGKSSTPRDHG